MRRHNTLQWFVVPAIAGALFALTACDGSTSHSTVQGIESVGGLTMDPVVARAYVTDRRGVLHGIDLRDGQTPNKREFGTELAGVAVAPCGLYMAVALPEQNVLSVHETSTFFQREYILLPHSPTQLVWTGTHKVVTATDGGLLEVDVSTHEFRKIDELADQNCLLAHDAARERLFVLHEVDGQLRVRCLSLSGDKDDARVLSTSSGQLVGRGIALQLSWHGDVLMVATDSGEGTYLLNSDTLETVGTAFAQEGLAAATFNATGTRMYQARASTAVTGFNFGDFEADFEVFPFASVTERNLAMAADGLNLVMHLSSGEVDLRRAFDLQLLGNPVAQLRGEWSLELRGTPGARMRVFLSIEPGFIFLDPPKTPERRFLDLDLSSLQLLVKAKLNASGRKVLTFNVPTNRRLEGVRFILQAVSLADGRLGEISNPLVVKTSELNCR